MELIKYENIEDFVNENMDLILEKDIVRIEKIIEIGSIKKSMFYTKSITLYE